MPVFHERERERGRERERERGREGERMPKDKEIYTKTKYFWDRSRIAFYTSLYIDEYFW